MEKRKALGQAMGGTGWEGFGLSALVPTAPPAPLVVPTDAAASSGVPIEIRTDQIIPNRYQPRETFDKERLEALAASLKQYGFIQPVAVRALPDGRFELIAGERRMRAAALAGFSTVPATIKTVDDRAMMEYALLENVQREELNPIEKARAFSRLLTEFSLTQEEIADRVGIDRSSVANTLRLLLLPEPIGKDIAAGKISMGHAKALLALPTKGLQLKFAEDIKTGGLSVRQVEARVKALTQQTKGGAERVLPTPGRSPEMQDLEGRLQRALGTKVRIAPSGKGKGGETKGEIRIEYYSLSDLDRILEKMM